MKVRILDGEYWYGLSAFAGTQFPIGRDSTFSWHPTTQCSGNQEAPLLVSTKGRYIWSETPYDVDVSQGEIQISHAAEDCTLYEGFTNLKNAYLDAARHFFPANGEIPHPDFFAKPQYNTWTELIYDQTQEGILRYAHGIIEHGLPAGIIMIDDGWMRFYGSREFDLKAIPDAKGMIRELHEMGFSVMLWVCPFISPDSAVFREAESKEYLVRNRDGGTAIRHWWNGYSAVVDMSNPKAAEWFCASLDFLMAEYGVDGFKFDAGDFIYYEDSDRNYGDVTPHQQCELWAKLGMRYRFNEYRACYKCAGLPLVQRLGDKDHAWHSISKLIADTLAQGILGFSYGCPDMIGGGQFHDFLPGAPTLMPELFVRYAQCATFMPMMQYSAAPWRVLPPEYAALCVKAAHVHMQYSDCILALAHRAAVTNEPIVRYMEYEYPGEGFEAVIDQFMVGTDILVAPVTVEGSTARDVKLPRGTWKYCDGTLYKGGKTITVHAPLEVLPYFMKQYI